MRVKYRWAGLPHRHTAQKPSDQFYRPLTQRPMPGSILLRTAGDVMSLSRQARWGVLEVDPQTAINRPLAALRSE